MLLSNVIATLRYQSVLQTLSSEVSILFFPLLKLNILTLFLAHFLPFGALADAMRALVSRRMLNIPVGLAVEGVVVDRCLAVIGLTFFGLLLLPLQFTTHWAWPLIITQAAAFGGILSLFVIVGYGFGRVKFTKSITEAVLRFAKLFATRHGRCWQLFFATANIGLFTAMLALLAHSLNLDLPLWLALTVTPTVYLSQVIPLFYAGFGSREVALAALLVPSSALNQSDAVALGLSVGLCNLVASFPGVMFAWLAAQQLSASTRDPKLK